MNDNHKKKMIAPVIVTVIFLLYLAIYLLVIMFASGVVNDDYMSGRNEITGLSA